MIPSVAQELQPELHHHLMGLTRGASRRDHEGARLEELLDLGGTVYEAWILEEAVRDLHTLRGQPTLEES